MKTNAWNALKSTDEIVKVIDLFKKDFSESEGKLDHVYEICNFAVQKGNPIELQYVINQFLLFDINLLFDKVISSGKYVSREQFAEFVEKLELCNYNLHEKDETVELFDDVIIKASDYRRKNSFMHIMSLCLYYRGSQFKPVIYPSRFDLIERNCEVLGIELPEMPHTNDYRAYAMYYFDMCEVFNQFQKENGLTDEEFCACLYQFAEMMQDDEDAKGELPRPTNVWMTGANKEDQKKFKENGVANSNSIWACNERTRRGDIVIIYGLAPMSGIHSIWRANSGGFFNPFDYYQHRTTVCEGIEVPMVSNKELKEHPYFSQVSIVKKNLQGVNGVELSATDYAELLNLLSDKGYDTESLPKLVEGGDYIAPETPHEKDVEEKILIPCLRDILGYKDTDWSRQLQQKAGRKEKAIPDFVFFHKGEEHMEYAPFMIEAKLDMAPARELHKAYRQGLSYIRMLRGHIFGICDKDRLVLYPVDENGQSNFSKPLFEAQWVVIYSDDEVRSRLIKLIGREVIASKVK